MKRTGLTLIEIVVIIAILVVVMSILVFVSPRGCPRGHSYWCNSNLHQLSLLIKIYSDDNNGDYPSPDNWCDLLVDTYLHSVKPDFFLCPGAIDKITEDSNQSSYVLNKNIVGMKASEIPPDVVLLFEGPVGWNRMGGPELLTTAYHKEEGAFICFADIRVKFVRTEELAALKWK